MRTDLLWHQRLTVAGGQDVGHPTGDHEPARRGLGTVTGAQPRPLVRGSGGDRRSPQLQLAVLDARLHAGKGGQRVVGGIVVVLARAKPPTSADEYAGRTVSPSAAKKLTLSNETGAPLTSNQRT